MPWLSKSSICEGLKSGSSHGSGVVCGYPIWLNIILSRLNKVYIIRGTIGSMVDGNVLIKSI